MIRGSAAAWRPRPVSRSDRFTTSTRRSPRSRPRRSSAHPLRSGRASRRRWRPRAGNWARSAIGSVLRAGAAEAAIFDVHVEILEDPELVSAVLDRVEQGDPAARAWKTTLDGRAAALARLDDVLLAARAADLSDVAGRVLRLLGTGPALGAAARPPGRDRRTRPLALADNRLRRRPRRWASVPPPAGRPRTPPSWPARWASPRWSARDPTCCRGPRDRRSCSTARRAPC